MTTNEQHVNINETRQNYGTSNDNTYHEALSSESSSIQSSPSDYKQPSSCCKIIDYSEPVIFIVIIFSIISVIYTIIDSINKYWLIFSITIIICFLICLWRIRKLGIAYAIMESVNEFKKQNKLLSNEVNELNNINNNLDQQVDTLICNLRMMEQHNIRLSDSNYKLEMKTKELSGLVGLLGENVNDIDKATEDLLLLYNKYKNENNRYESNNMLSLFNLVDQDNNGKLNKDEITRLKEYVKIVYHHDLNLDKYDINGDHVVSLKEFIEQFKDQVQIQMQNQV